MRTQGYKRPKRPRWSTRTSFIAGLCLLGFLTPLTLITVHRSIWQELEIITGALSLLAFVYLTAVLYKGVRFDKSEGFSVDWPQVRPGEMLKAMDWTPVDSGGFFTEAGAEAGLLGAVVGFLLDLLVSIFLAALISMVIWLGLNAAVGIILAVFLPVFYLYRRSLRFIVARGRTCRGSFGKSVLYALGATALYTVWFYAIFHAAHHFSRLASG